MYCVQIACTQNNKEEMRRVCYSELLEVHILSVEFVKEESLDEIFVGGCHPLEVAGWSKNQLSLSWLFGHSEGLKTTS